MRKLLGEIGEIVFTVEKGGSKDQSEQQIQLVLGEGEGDKTLDEGVD